MDNDRILLIRTGGTVDSEPYPDPRNPPEFVETLKDDASLIMPMLKQLPNHERVDGLSWGAWDEDRFVKDSQKFTQGDMEALAEVIRNDSRRYFILTHGTDHMAKNASTLKKLLEGSGKTVIFNGAMVPLSMHQQHPSDIFSALQFTLDNIDNQPEGVYIVGRDNHSKRLSFFDPETVEKDKPASIKDLTFTVRTR